MDEQRVVIFPSIIMFNKVLRYSLLIRPIVQLYLYSGIEYN